MENKQKKNKSMVWASRNINVWAGKAEKQIAELDMQNKQTQRNKEKIQTNKEINKTKAKQNSFETQQLVVTEKTQE